MYLARYMRPARMNVSESMRAFSICDRPLSNKGNRQMRMKIRMNVLFMISSFLLRFNYK